MDYVTLQSLGAKVTLIRRSYSRKIGDGAYGSIGGEMSAEAVVAEGADGDAVSKALAEWCRKQVADDMEAQKAALRDVPQPEEKSEPPKPPLPEETEPSVPFGPGEKEESFKVVQFEFIRRTDGKFQLNLFPEIAGKVGQYAEVKYVAEQTAMWEMLEPVAGGISLKTPMTLAVNWVATWKQGRPTGKTHKDGTPSHYKDLLSLRMG